eukprot:2989187-Rhodomonas_salina.2
MALLGAVRAGVADRPARRNSGAAILSSPMSGLRGTVSEAGTEGGRLGKEGGREETGKEGTRICPYTHVLNTPHCTVTSAESGHDHRMCVRDDADDDGHEGC